MHRGNIYVYRITVHVKIPDSNLFLGSNNTLFLGSSKEPLFDHKNRLLYGSLGRLSMSDSLAPRAPPAFLEGGWGGGA